MPISRKIPFFKVFDALSSRKSIMNRHKKAFERENYQKATLSYPPRWITIGITSVCNNRCSFCAYHSIDAKDKSNVYNIPFTLGLNDFKRMVDFAHRGYISHVHICGTGEPFFNKDVINMIDYTISVYGHSSIQTNFYKPLFDKHNYIEEIIKRGDHISYITTDILSGDPEEHNAIKKGSNYSDVMDALEYISSFSPIKFHINVVLTKHNYKHLSELVEDVSKRNIRATVSIVNLFAYDFNPFSSMDAVYQSADSDMRAALEACQRLGQSLGIKVSIPSPTDGTGQCNVFWSKVQTWPVKGIDETRGHENLVPHACRAVVLGSLNSLGYLFDYPDVMSFWNSEKLVSIRQGILDGKYPSDECQHCYMHHK
ncbi:radical SAM protein [Desulfovibrio sp. OttesenSCG-928-I05]|nr:radical SAM protein [Desulfovibrio sp. OttesenSCG-928-I05]